MNAPVNLDHQAAVWAQAIVKQWQGRNEGKDESPLENTIRRTLGVVQDNGLAAAALFLAKQQKKEDSAAGAIVQTLFAVAKGAWEASADQPNEASELLEYLIKDVTGDLDRLLLVKDLWEQTLIYARYAAAAL
jgi:hypothetical protein